VCATLLLALCGATFAADWPQWGGSLSKNMVAAGRRLPDVINPGSYSEGSSVIDPTTTKNLKWVATLGSETCGTPVIAGGRIYIGTNNAMPYDQKYQGDRGVLLCLDEKTGKLLWQLNLSRHPVEGCYSPLLGVMSAPFVEGDRVYVVTNRDELLCLDANGLANGNDGPFTDEAQFVAGKGNPPIPQGPTDADIIWSYDMTRDLHSFAHDGTDACPIVVGDLVYTCTCNGMDDTAFKYNANARANSPECPTIIAVNKKTGAFVAGDDAQIAHRLTHGQWGNPAYGVVNGKGLVFFGGGDGICYAFDPTPTPPDKDGKRYLRTVWSYDGNPPAYRAKQVVWHDKDGRNEIIATPVFYKNRVYFPMGQDPEIAHGKGTWGLLCCVDATKTGVIPHDDLVWSFNKLNRSVTTLAIADGLVYAADIIGDLYCLDADTGQQYWKYPTHSDVWASPLVADGKIYLANARGDFFILKAGQKMKELCKIRFPEQIIASPVVANNVLYVASYTTLYAFQVPKR
jgi:outer membrane protein assembly factor BamB